jgi:hypothetical protein
MEGVAVEATGQGMSSSFQPAHCPQRGGITAGVGEEKYHGPVG